MSARTFPASLHASLRRGLLALALAGALAGCATLPDGSATPLLARLPPDELARLSPSADKLVPADLAAMARAGVPAATIIERFRASGARFDLSPTQVVELHAAGVPLAVLEAIHVDREQALRTDLTQMLVERDRQCAADVEGAQKSERLRGSSFCSPYPWGFYGPGPLFYPYPRYRR